MKKIFLASLIALSSHAAFADTKAPAVDPTFQKFATLVQAKDFKNAYKEIDNIAQTGNPQALYNLGYLTQTGQGTKQNDAKALELYKQSSDKGYPIASYLLANIYLTGILGVNPDENTAKTYLEKAASQGFEDANVNLAMLIFRENTDAGNKKALNLIDPLVKKGSMPATHLRANYDIQTGIKEKKNETIKTGLENLQKLAQQGYIPALMEVGNILVAGKLVQQNLDEAKKIFSILAEKNVPHSKEALDEVNKMMAQQPKAPAKKG